MTSLMPRLFGELHDMFERDFPLASHIRVEEFLDKDKYVVRAELPGMDPDEDVSVMIEHGVLTIDAQRKAETRDKHRTEFRYGAFHRAVLLPDGADDTHATAAYEKGILTVTVPMAEPERVNGRSIPIEKG